jgi:hypothetical protein
MLFGRKIRASVFFEGRTLFYTFTNFFSKQAPGVTTSLENEFVRVIHKYSTDARRNAPLREWWWLKIDAVIVCVGFGV